MTMLVVAVNGAMRSGKNTLVDHLKQRLQPTVRHTEVAFARPVKSMLKALMGDEAFLRAEADRGMVWAPAGISYRNLMRTLGSGWGRDLVDADLWANIGIMTIEQFFKEAERIAIDAEDHDRHAVVFVTDLRFANELHRLRDFNHLIVTVERDGCGWSSMTAWQKLKHYLWIERVHDSERPLEAAYEKAYGAYCPFGMPQGAFNWIRVYNEGNPWNMTNVVLTTLLNNDRFGGSAVWRNS